MTDAQLFAGIVVGFGLSVTLRRFAMTLANPETRWTTVGVIVVFAMTWGAVCAGWNLYLR
jgi:hypothetical protein